MKALCTVCMRGSSELMDSFMVDQEIAFKGLAIPRYPGKVWTYDRDSTFGIANPLTIPELATYCTNLPSHSQQTQKRVICLKNPEDNAKDIFDCLPVELCYGIASNVSISTFNCLRAASRAFRRLGLDGTFWKNRLSNDMPWLYWYGLPSHDRTHAHNPPQTVDWAQVYQHLLRKSEFLDANSAWPRLVNRRRIWARCEVILKHYFARQRSILEAAFSTSELCEDAACTTMVRLLHPNPRDCEPFTILLFDNFEVVPETRPTLQISWTYLKELRSMKLLRRDPACTHAVPKSSRQTFRQMHRSVKYEEILVFPEDSWLSAVIITSQEDATLKIQFEPCRSVIGLRFVFTNGEYIQAGDVQGDQRLIQVPEGEFAVGFRGEVSYDGRVSMLAILSQPMAKLSSVTSQRRPQSTPEANQQLQKYIWRGAIPPSSLEVVPHTFRYSNSLSPRFYMRTDLSVMEPLIFGTTEDEISDITGFRAYETFHGFEVQYKHRDSRSIGRKMSGFKTLPSTFSSIKSAESPVSSAILKI